MTLLLLLAADILLIHLLRKSGRDSRKAFRLGAAFLLLFLEIAEQYWFAATGSWKISSSLPLHLCRIGSFLTALMLLTRSYRLYEIAYFWALAGAVNALLTPAISVYGFPHFRFFKFFLSHNLLVLAPVYMTLAEGYRPTLASLGRVAVITHLYAGVAALVNFRLGSNYLYLSRNPGGSTLLGWFGEWPSYLPALWGAGVLLFLLVYAPFPVRDWWKRRGGSLSREEDYGGQEG